MVLDFLVWCEMFDGYGVGIFVDIEDVVVIVDVLSEFLVDL